MRSHRVGIIILAACLAAAAAAAAPAGPAAARTWQVPADAPTVAAAIDSAASGDVIEISGGTYPESGLVLKSGLTIRSADPQGGVTIDAGGAGRIFSGTLADSVTLSGLTLTGGHSTNGAALKLTSCLGVEVRDCAFVANTTSIAIGGALQVDAGSSIVIEDCRFEANDCQLDDGGAIWLSAGEAEITRCAFVGNHAINGGAISTSSPGARITDCTFEANDAGNGGAIDFRGNAATVTDCLFVGNTATRGGAVGCWYESTPQLVGCTLVGNEATDQGSGIYCTSASVATVERCIIALGAGGGAVGCEYEGAAVLSCCDVYGNAGGDWAGCIAGQEAGDGNFGLDPLFCPEGAGGSWELDSESPCLAGASPCGMLVGALGQGCSVSAAGAGGRGAPGAPVRLLGSRPNPFNPSTIVAFELDRPGTVDLRVYDLAGRLVRVLVAGERLDAGPHERRWDGRDDGGRGVAAGGYVFRVDSGGHQATGAGILVR